MANRSSRFSPFRNRSIQWAPFVAQLPFDLTLFDQAFAAPQDDRLLTDLLLQHYQTLIPPPEEQQVLSQLVSRILTCLEAIVVNPAKFSSGQLEEVRAVGNFKLGTSLAGQNSAELVVVFRTLPTMKAVTDLGDIVTKSLNESDLGRNVTLDFRVHGFNICSDKFVVAVMITTVAHNLKNLDADVHIKPPKQRAALALIRQTLWLEENATHTTVKVLTRITRDFCRRFHGFRHLSNWLISMLAHYVVMQNPTKQALPVNQAFRRWLQLISACLLFPGSAGIIDPCEPKPQRLHTFMSLNEQDEVCRTARTLLRIMEHGAAELLFSHNSTSSMDDLLKAASQMSGIQIESSEVAFGSELSQRSSSATS